MDLNYLDIIEFLQDLVIIIMVMMGYLIEIWNGKINLLKENYF